jgi:cation:H+ antiporter
MLLPLLLVLLSLLILFAGAEGLVRGSASAALRLGISPLVVGLTIVAFGTSAPELLVSIKATLAGQGDIAVGNVVGSNSFNIGIILGLAALICPVPAHRQIIRLDAPLALGVALLLPLLLRDGLLGRGEAGLLFAGLVGYTAFNVWMARRENALDPEEAPAVTRSAALDGAFIVGGLALLVFGSNLLVENAVILARLLEVSEAVIGLTIIAAGTSMPELATSVVAALRRQPDIAVGNVVGSNIFNILGILGVAGLISPLQAPGIGAFDYGAMIGFSVLLIPMLYTGARLHRVEGVALLALYGGYLAWLWPT